MSVRWRFFPLADLAEHAPAWDALNASAGGLPFLESAFLLPLAEQFARGGEFIALAHDGDAAVAGAILQRDGVGRVTTFQPSQLPLGPWLVAAGQDPWVLARSLLGALPGFALGLGLTQLDPLSCVRPATSPTLATLDYIETAWVDVQGSFDAYWEARGKNLRANLGKQRRKLEAEGTVLQVQTLRSPQDVASAIATYGRLETAGWKAELGTAVDAGNAQGRFYTAMLERFCALGRGRIWQLRFGDRIVAMDLCIESARTIVILKTTFDPEFRNVSPAFLMRQDVFRQLFDGQQLERIEFYGRLMEWHTRWTDNRRTLYHGNVYRWSILPRLRDQLRRLRGGDASRQPEAPASADHAA
jgi:CelD/BcsL family acetyltransferase involved in cellulose biosynthesis